MRDALRSPAPATARCTSSSRRSAPHPDSAPRLAQLLLIDLGGDPTTVTRPARLVETNAQEALERLTVPLSVEALLALDLSEIRAAIRLSGLPDTDASMQKAKALLHLVEALREAEGAADAGRGLPKASASRPTRGDKVKVATNAKGRKGQVGTISMDEKDGQPYRIDFADEKNVGWFKESEVAWIGSDVDSLLGSVKRNKSK